ncbi:MAG: hypothetical protein J6L71_06060, partial [Clostridia bacterium]|nr:hypothetical protein [Clostridia bacterium]
LYGLLVAIVGLGVVVFSSGGASNDTDLEYQISERIKNLQELSEKKNEVYERSFLKMLRPVNLRGYDFEAKEDPFYYKKGKDSVHRTNYFAGCNLIFTNEKVFIYARRFSLIDEAIDNVTNISYYFTDLDRAEIEEKIYEYKKGDRTIQVKYYVFRILKTDGTPALEMCVDYGADIDKYAEQISRCIVTRKMELAKRAEETAQRRAEFRARVEAEKAAIARGEMEDDTPAY